MARAIRTATAGVEAPARKTKVVRVRAIRMGYYGDQRHSPDNKKTAVFDYVLGKGEELPSWVVPVGANEELEEEKDAGNGPALDSTRANDAPVI